MVALEIQIQSTNVNVQNKQLLCSYLISAEGHLLANSPWNHTPASMSRVTKRTFPTNYVLGEHYTQIIVNSYQLFQHNKI